MKNDRGILKLEFLMTYGWAILIPVLVVVAILIIRMKA